MEASYQLDIVLLWQLPVFIALLVASGFFSGSETALFNLKRSEIEKLKHDLAPSSRLIVKLMDSPKRLLITILTGNTVVNVILASMAALITSSFAQHYGYNEILALMIETVVLTIILVLFGEITPKVLAIRHSLGFSSRIAGLMTIVFRLFSPIAQITYNVVQKLVTVLGVKPEETFTSDDEILELVKLGQDQGVIGSEEKEMIHSIIEYGDTKAKEIMIPRPDVVMLHTEMHRDEILQLIRESSYSKFPLYKDQIDKIQGIVYIKDILPYLHGTTQRINLERIARPAMFVPEHQLIDSLLRDMQRQKQKLAIVVDEFGGFSGMITVEDIIEEVLGDLRDELDTAEEEHEIQKIDENIYIIDATTNLDVVAEEIGIDFPGERDYDSIGGYIYDMTGRIPKTGERINLTNYTLEVIKVDKHRIQTVKLIKTSDKVKINDKSQ